MVKISKKRKVKARVVINYQNNLNKIYVEVPSKLFIKLLEEFLRTVTIPGQAGISLADIIRIESLE